MRELRGFASPPHDGFAFIGRCLSLCQYTLAIDRVTNALYMRVSGPRTNVHIGTKAAGAARAVGTPRPPDEATD
jgi:hypothetical protein